MFYGYYVNSSAAILPLLTALSIVEGKPCIYPVPARKKFCRPVVCLGRVFRISFDGTNVARFSFIILYKMILSQADFYIFLQFSYSNIKNFFLGFFYIIHPHRLLPRLNDPCG